MKREPGADYRTSEVTAHVQLFLDSSQGENYYSALRIAQYVRAEGIATIVGKESVCASACAFIFMAGQSLQPYMEPEPDRTIEIGGVVKLHSPFVDKTEGTFAEGKKAIVKMRKVMRGLLPEELFFALNKKGAHESVKIARVWDVMRWNIQLEGYKSPFFTREALYNACVNDAAWHRPRHLGPLTDEVHSLDVSAERENEEEGTYLTDDDGNTIVDRKFGPIRIKDYPLPAEESDSAISVRQIFEAPYLLKLTNIGSGRVAAQFAFDVVDTPAAAWCTAWTVSGGIAISRRARLDVRVLFGRGGGAVYNADDVVPDWYAYPPGRTLESIKE